MQSEGLCASKNPVIARQPRGDQARGQGRRIAATRALSTPRRLRLKKASSAVGSFPRWVISASAPRASRMWDGPASPTRLTRSTRSCGRVLFYDTRRGLRPLPNLSARGRRGRPRSSGAPRAEVSVSIRRRAALPEALSWRRGSPMRTLRTTPSGRSRAASGIGWRGATSAASWPMGGGACCARGSRHRDEPPRSRLRFEMDPRRRPLPAGCEHSRPPAGKIAGSRSG